MGNKHYLAYYQLHEIPWKLTQPIRLEGRPTGVQVQVGRGPYTIPKMANPTITPRAGGARVETVNDTYELEGDTYFGIAIPVEADLDKGAVIPQSEWDKLAQLADDCASVVGLCLNQRTGLSKVAEYVRENENDGSVGKLQFRWQAFSGAPAIVSKRSSESIRRALGRVLGEQVSPQVLVALRWYEQSKTVTLGADRFLSLWVALEALMGSVRDNVELIRNTAQFLTKKEFRLRMDAEGIKQALGLDHMRKVRNEIIHKGDRLIPWPVSHDPDRRDWPQILDDIVGEILRHRLNSTLTRTLNKHVADGLRGGSHC